MNPKVLSSEGWNLLSNLVSASLLEGWTLCGGTGLALQFGHRISKDLDFFRTEEFDVDDLIAGIADISDVNVTGRARNTLHVIARGIRLSFLRLEAPLLYPGTTYRGITVGDTRDIATLKLVAIGGRGSRKDFIDLYYYLKQAPGISDLFDMLESRSARIDWNKYHLMKSLTYFEDADLEPMPEMLVELDWEEVKAFFREQAKSLL